MPKNEPRSASIDPIQVFCMSFDSPQTFETGVSRRAVENSAWNAVAVALTPSELMTARITRMTIEAFQCALAGHAAAFAQAVAYVDRPIEDVLDARILVKTLLSTDPPLANAAEREALIAVTLERAREYQARVRARVGAR